MSEEVTEVFTTADEAVEPIQAEKFIVIRSTVSRFHAEIMGATAIAYPGNERKFSSVTLSYINSADKQNSAQIYLSLDEAEKLRNFLIEALAENKE